MLGCMGSCLYLFFSPIIMGFYLLRFIIEVCFLLSKYIFSTFFDMFNDLARIEANSPRNIKTKIRKDSYKDLKFDNEAKLWGLSEEDKKIAKKERMSPADFIKAEETDDDELIYNEWEK